LVWRAHNLLLDTAPQVGIPGVLLLLLLLGATVREGWRMARSPNDAAAGCGIALICFVAGMLVRNMTDTLWVRQNALFYWGSRLGREEPGRSVTGDELPRHLAR
jgi:O-antigen ligase